MFSYLFNSDTTEKQQPLPASPEGSETSEVHEGSEISEVHEGSEISEVHEGSEISEVHEGSEISETYVGPEESETSETPEGSETSELHEVPETGAESVYIPREYPHPACFMVNGKPLDKTSSAILHMYIRSIGTGVLVGGSVGSVIGTIFGFALSTVSLPFVLLYSAIETSVEDCKRKKE